MHQYPETRYIFTM